MKNDILAFLWPAVAGLLAAVLILDRWVIDQPSAESPVAQSSFSAAVTEATPSVVNIFTRKRVLSRQGPFFNDPLLRRFLGPQRQRIEQSLGSGVIMTAEGHILTNNHVIAGAEAIQVQLYDGRSASASIVGSDPATDLAVLKVELPDLKPAVLANSDLLRVGDIVLAIGNPYGFGHSVSQGVIGGVGRYGQQLGDFTEFIQTDAAILPGSSGGALIDTEGRLVGINTLIYTAGSEADAGGNGINLATPSNLASWVLQDLIAYGSVVRGWLGVSVELVEARTTRGEVQRRLRVAGVDTDGPADRAGLQVGDYIVALDDVPISDGSVAMREIIRLRPGERVVVALQRGDQQLTVTAIVGARDATG